MSQVWKSQFHASLIERNRAEANSFLALVRSHEQILRDCLEIKQQNNQLKKQNKEQKEQLEKLNQQIEGHLSTGASVQITSQRVRELEDKIFSLQEELTSSLRSKADTSQQILDLTNEVQNLKQQLKEKQSEIAANTKLTQTVEDKNKVIQVMREESEAIRIEIKQANETASKLQEENKAFVQRIIEQKQRQYQNRQTLDSNNSEFLMLDPLDSNLGAPTIRPPVEIHHDISLDTQINDIDFSEDNQYIALAANDKSIKVYYTKSGQLHSSFFGCADSVVCVAFSPNNQMLLGGSADHACRLWSMGNARAKHTLTGHTKQVYAADFAGDNKAVTGSYDRTIKVWELNQGTCIKTMLNAKSKVHDLEVGKNNSTLFSAHFDSCIRMFDLRSYDLVREITKAHESQVTSINISRDDLYLVTCGRDSVCKVWDARRSYEPVHVLSHPDYKVNMETNKVTFSPCGSYVASGSVNGQVFVWKLKNAHDDELDSTLKGHKGLVTCVSWSPDGSVVASASVDKRVIMYQ
ncbi:autophagy-related protein ATG16 [Acrasis kona]|uniref:Autophagy-related protein ATG16 n=1 Tax=Acrasis kona TaxID=1008807 RepID=A0AAW2YVK0_9EUKA